MTTLTQRMLSTYTKQENKQEMKYVMKNKNRLNT